MSKKDTLQNYQLLQMLFKDNPQNLTFILNVMVSPLQGNRTFEIFIHSLIHTLTKLQKWLKRRCFDECKSTCWALNYAPCDLCIGRGLKQY